MAPLMKNSLKRGFTPLIYWHYSKGAKGANIHTRTWVAPLVRSVLIVHHAGNGRAATRHQPSRGTPRSVLALTEFTAAIRHPSGSITTYRRFNKPALGPLSMDDFSD